MSAALQTFKAKQESLFIRKKMKPNEDEQKELSHTACSNLCTIGIMKLYFPESM